MKTVQNRKRKFAFSMKIIAALSCIAIASVGFASWLVVHEPEDQSTAGDVNVALTSSAELVLETKTPDVLMTGNVSADKFVFGRPATSEVGIKWLVPEDVEIEDLIEEHVLTYTPQNLPKNSKAVFKLDFNGVHKTVSGETTNYDHINDRVGTLISKGYLTLTITFGTESKTFDKENEFSAEDVIVYTIGWDELNALQTAGNSADIAFKVEFKWGDAFEEINPYDYYNGLEAPTAEDKAAALSVLSEIADIVNGTGIYAGGTTETPTATPLSYLITIDASIDLSDLSYPS